MHYLGQPLHGPGVVQILVDVFHRLGDALDFASLLQKEAQLAARTAQQAERFSSQKSHINTPN
jgi:hypothetical protein